LLAQHKELETQLEVIRKKRAAEAAKMLLEQKVVRHETPAIVEQMDGLSGDDVQAIADALKGQFEGVVVLAGTEAGSVSLMVTVSPNYAAKWNAGKIVQTIAPLVGGKGGGRAETARAREKMLARLRRLLPGRGRF
jgi:alanyl-tRNA synthetase